jgi:NADH:ubiquinone oxidoreductase subunit 6 (subunit J)
LATPAKKPKQTRAQWWSDTKADLKWAVVLLFVLTTGIAAFYQWKKWEAAPASEENLTTITALIFSQRGLVVPFEILSVLLLAALVAGVVIAFRDPEGVE